MQIQVKSIRKLRLEVFQVWVNGTMLAEFLSAAQANSKALQFGQYLKGESK